MSVDTQAQDLPPFMVVLKLTEGYVLQYGGGYTVALTNPVDLAKRVQDVAEQSETGFQAPTPQSLNPSSQPTPVTPELVEAAAVPSTTPRPPSGVVPTTNLEAEWSNARLLIAFMAAGFDSNGKAFTRSDFDKALPMFAPHVNPKEVEHELSEFLAEMHDD